MTRCNRCGRTLKAPTASGMGPTCERYVLGSKPAADGPRYKALGNSWAVPCARWIGERIESVEALSRTEQRVAA